MYFKIDWQIQIGNYKLGMLDNVEIHKSVELLADTCSIKLPATLYNKAISTGSSNEVESKIERGNKVTVWLGYDTKNFNNVKPEFEGYLLNAATDDGSLILNCEDDLFLLRKTIADKQFKNTDIRGIAEYVVTQTGSGLLVDCSYTMNYDKFVINKATGYDVLKKISEETKGNVYIKKNEDGKSVLNIHPPYTEKHGYVRYSFQKNIESSDLKYKKADDKILEVVVESTGKDGKKISVSAGKPGGDKKTISGNGMSKDAMQKLADETYKKTLYDGYEGGITTWLIPNVEPGYSAEIKDEEYEFKNGWYYVKSVTTTCSSSGIVRKVDMGIKVAAP
jgi:hypothetical protein